MCKSLSVVHWNDVWISYRFWDIGLARYWSKITILIPLCILCPRSGGPRLSTSIVWYGKTRTVWLSGGKKSFTICLAVPIEYRRVTYIQTDGQTERHFPRYAYASRGKNAFTNVQKPWPVTHVNHPNFVTDSTP